MIASLRGRLAERRAIGDVSAELVVEVGGVGYLVAVTARTAIALSGQKDEVFLSIYSHVREGEITLYGFVDDDERVAFEALLAAHGVGPALGLAILGIHRPETLAGIVEAEDLDGLMAVPGVGRKTAARLLIELAGKFAVRGATASSAGGGSGRLLASTLGRRDEVGARGDVVETLLGLGYASEEIRRAMLVLPADGSVADLLRSALRELAHVR